MHYSELVKVVEEWLLKDKRRTHTYMQHELQGSLQGTCPAPTRPASRACVTSPAGVPAIFRTERPASVSLTSTAVPATFGNCPPPVALQPFLATPYFECFALKERHVSSPKRLQKTRNFFFIQSLSAKIIFKLMKS